MNDHARAAATDQCDRSERDPAVDDLHLARPHVFGYEERQWRRNARRGAARAQGPATTRLVSHRYWRLRVARRRSATLDPQTFQAQQVAALAAGRQNHFWDYVELFYRQQGTEGTSYVTEKYLNGLAQQIPPLSLDAWRSARSDSLLIAELQSDRQTATAARVQGTPTLIFQGPRGKAQTPETLPSYDQLQQAITSVA